MNNYTQWLQNKNFSFKTIEVYNKAIKYYGQQSLTTENIITFVKKLAQEREPATCRLYATALLSYAKYQKITNLDWERIKALIPKIQKKFYTTINEQELELLKKARFEKSSWLHERNNLMLDFLFYTGTRASELVNIRHRDYQDNSLRIYGKGNKIRHVLIPDFLIKYFKFNSPGYLFTLNKQQKIATPQIQRIIQKRVKLTRISKWITPHTFRRSLATNLYKRGGKLETIQKQLGHSHIQTTLGYIHSDHNTLYQDYSKLFQENPRSNQALKGYSTNELLAELSRRTGETNA